MLVVAERPVVDVVKGTLQGSACDDTADENEDECGKVEEEDDTASLLRSRHDRKDRKKEDGHADLDAVNDAHDDGGVLESDDRSHHEVDLCLSIWHGDAEILLVRIETRSEVPCRIWNLVGHGWRLLQWLC